MPIYEYRCTNGHTFEVFKSMSDEPASECVECGAPVERVFHPVAVHYKGSGFYATDYAKKNAEGKPSEDSKKKDGDSDAKKSEKPEAKSESAKSAD
jgi:putative FmdB family regulatory protein